MGAREQAYVRAMRLQLVQRIPSADGRLSAFVVGTLLVIGLLLAGSIALWAHYGTAVFYEMIVAGIAACL